jgi:hypothetical protein
MVPRDARTPRLLDRLRGGGKVLTGIGLVLSLGFAGLSAAPAEAITSRTPSVQAAASFTSSPVPTITGKAIIGGRLQATTPRWTPTVVPKYAWFSGGVLLPGKTATSYVVQASDAGKSITVQATGIKTGFTALTRPSLPTAVVPVPVLKPFVRAVVPTVSGTAKVGSTLTGKVGVWSPVATYGYQWFRDGSAVAGRTALTYQLEKADAGRKITFEVTGTKTGYADTSKTSAAVSVPGVPLSPSPAPTAPAPSPAPIPTSAPSPSPVPSPTVPPVKVPFENSPKPLIPSTSSVGSTVTADVSSWKPANATLEYTWWVSDVAVPGETSATYVLRAEDLGKRVTVTVTGTKTGYTAARQTSNILRVTPALPVDQGYDVVLIVGQSNAQGAGFGYDPNIDVRVPGLYQLAGSGVDKGKILEASDTLHHVSTWLTKALEPRVGPGMEFGRRLIAANPQRKVLLVPAAEGSTTLLNPLVSVEPGVKPPQYIWNPTPDGPVEMKLENLYTRAQSQLDVALETPGSKLVAVIWAQGETDSGVIHAKPASEQAAAKALYRDRLLELIDGMSAREPGVPFLMGGMVPEWVAAPEKRAAKKMIDDVHRGVPGLRGNVSFVEGVSGQHNLADPAALQDEELVHYNAIGAREMGERYYEAYVAAAKKG